MKCPKCNEVIEVTARTFQSRGLDLVIDEDEPCNTCAGSGYKAYGDTSTWRHGCGGQSITTDVCDVCWGSGVKDKPWPSWRTIPSRKEYKKLQRDSELLRALIESGVDNWEGYGIAMDSLQDIEGAWE